MTVSTKKIKHFNHDEPLETSRLSRLAPLPPKLAPILELVNLIPADIEVDEVLIDGLWSIRNELADGELTRDECEPAAKSVISELPQALRQWIELRVRYFDEDGIIEAAHYIHFFRESRSNLRQIARAAAAIANNRQRVHATVSAEAWIFVDRTGRVRIEKDSFADAIDELDATRLRECEVCKLLFWAGRKDKFSCSEDCAHAHRNRRYRLKRAQGFYQGARLTKKERAASLRGHTKRQSATNKKATVRSKKGKA